MVVNEDSDGWVVIGSEPGRRQLAFQRANQWVPPSWPDRRLPQQMHLDIRVSDPDAAERELLSLGAKRTPGERETGFRVFTDPVGTRSASSSDIQARAEPGLADGPTTRASNDSFRAHPRSQTLVVEDALRVHQFLKDSLQDPAKVNQSLHLRARQRVILHDLRRRARRLRSCADVRARTSQALPVPD
jgi:hypothetical protein